MINKPIKYRSGSYKPLKVVIDVTLAFVLTLVLLPLLLLVAILIKLDSRGPAIYKQQRTGHHRKPFTIYKFRTMKVDAPLLSTEEMQKSGYVPITRIGNLLRKTSLDELPQLFNILKLEMSFVGPRPALLTQEDVNSLREQYEVHEVRPGITGFAQVKGRDDLDTDTKVTYDIEYCSRMSLAFDLALVFMTATAIITSRGNK